MKLLRFVAHYTVANFQAALEYRAAFWAQVFAMLLNDAMWIAFWGLFFSQFTVVRDYGFRDVVTIWGLAAFSFGIATGIFGNSWRYAPQVAQGGLDFFLVLPKPVLLHLIVSNMSWSAWGDALFGLGVYLALVHPTPPMLVQFLLLSVASMAIFVSYAVMANALVFWLGNAEGLSGQLLNALLLFSTYPGALFSGMVKVLLFTVVPAGFVVYLPVQLLREWSWPLAAALFAVAAGSVLLSTFVFYAGLRRYESGNLLAMRA
jgi:ABC-2 type transport system permease protein